MRKILSAIGGVAGLFILLIIVIKWMFIEVVKCVVIGLLVMGFIFMLMGIIRAIKERTRNYKKYREYKKNIYDEM